MSDLDAAPAPRAKMSSDGPPACSRSSGLPISNLELIGHTQPISEGNRDMRITEIQERVGRGEYRVDAKAVADAIVRRLLKDALPAPPQRPQGACS